MLSERMISVPPMINISGGSFAMSALVAAPASALVQVPGHGAGARRLVPIGMERREQRVIEGEVACRRDTA